MRRRFSYANVAATLALVFSMSGGALAASHYLITSSKQISPKVLAKLKGKSGATGATGPAGAAGKEGSKGEKGTAGETGPSHAYSAFGTENKEAQAIASVKVPAGNYAITGEGGFLNGSGKYGAGECVIEVPGNALADDQGATVPPVGEEEGREKEVFGSASIGTQATAQLKAEGTITEKCQTGVESQTAVVPFRARVTATLVGGLN